MAQPTPYNRLYDFSDYQEVNPTKPLRGSEVDAEFDAIKLTTDQIRANAALIQRDDGSLANQSVTPDSLSAGTLAMIHQGEYLPRGAWAATTAYAMGDLVTYNAATYLCIAAHTAQAAFPNDLAANRWLLIANGALSGQASAIDLFEGNAATTTYTLSYTYANSNAAVVFVGGVALIPVQDFTISGTTLTFVVAPPAPSVAGRKNVMVRGTGIEAQLAANAAAAAATDAQGFASAASGSASAAATSATAATGSASAAATSATNAANSATSSANSASTATTQATSATNSATAAAGSATAAAGSATSASGSASTATIQASNAAASATAASNSATNSANSATAAAGSATTATTQATNAAGSATAAAGSASSAAASAASAAAALDSFDDRYLGSKTSDPTVDNDGNPLVQGALYYRSTAPIGMKVYDGAQWIEASAAQQASLVTFEYVATAGQTTFTGADANGVTLSYTVGNVLVSLNGVRLRPGDDFTATTGTSVVLVVAAAVGDELIVDALKTFDVANTYTKAEADSLLAAKAPQATTYTKAEVDSQLARGLFRKANPDAPAWTKTGAGTAITASTIYAEVNGVIRTIPSGTAITMPTFSSGTDYAIWLTPAGALQATSDHTNPPVANSRKVGGFHYAPGGNATAQSGGNTTTQINEFSFWDLSWKPNCADPRGMTLVAGGFWSDIYLTGVDAITNGTSKFNVTMADGSSPPKVPTMFGGNGSTTYGSYTWFEAMELGTAFGKRCPTQQEFMALAYGTTEASSIGTDQVSTILNAIYTSRWGVIQATGVLWVWGRDRGGPFASAAWNANTEGRGSEYNAPNSALFGGLWVDGAGSGSRCSYWNAAASTSGGSVGSRFVCDHLKLD